MYDAVIIGAGVIGCAIARELSKYNLSVCVAERSEDVCTGTSKANSGIVHAGFDAPSGSLKAKLNVEGNYLMEQLSKDLEFPFQRNGSLVLCFDKTKEHQLEELKKQGDENGVEGLRILTKEEAGELEPNLSDTVTAALYAPTGGIVCPFKLTIALAENAAENGVEFRFHHEVKSIRKEQEGYAIDFAVPAEPIKTRIVINAAGVYADEICRMVSRRKIHITPRRGEYCLFDKTAGGIISHTLFQLPSEMGKGVLITPTVEGNLLLGPSAEDILEKEDTATTLNGLNYIIKTGGKSVKTVPMKSVITSFSGLRAIEDGKDFVIEEEEDAKGFFIAAGIQSPGLSSAPAIGRMAAELAAVELSARKKANFKSTRKDVIQFSALTNEERENLIKDNPLYGNIICRCEMVTEGEIVEAIHRPLGAKTLDGIKRRTRAGMGRCQSGFCMPKTMDILARELKLSLLDISKSGKDSKILEGYSR